MKYAIAAGLFLLFHTCTCSLEDSIIINNTTDLIPNITTIYPWTDKPTKPTINPITTSTVHPHPNTTTSPTTSTVSPNTTTISPNTTTTPSPNITTSTVSPTTPHPNVTTTITPNTTTPVIPTTPSTPHPNVTTTVTPNITTPVIPTTPSPPHPSRKFDGPSFVGGIVLATGLMAIGFIAFKFYKARAELNYHTL